MTKKLIVLALTGSLLSIPAATTAQDADPNITYRQKVMQSVGANIGAISDILKFSLPHQGNIESHAQQIANAASMIPSAFEANVTEGPTDAKPEIWDNWAEFEQYASDLQGAAESLAQTAAGGDAAAIGEAVKQMGGTCKQCHDDYRKPKEESYKQ